MALADTIAEILAPHLGGHTADVVARHVCAKFAADGELSDEERAKLQDFLRRGLVAYVGAETATRLAAECLADRGSASQ